MKGLKVFGWICFGLALVCLLLFNIVASNSDLFWSIEFNYWGLSSLIFFLTAILSWLVGRALKEIKNDLELKMLMKP